MYIYISRERASERERELGNRRVGRRAERKLIHTLHVYGFW